MKKETNIILPSSPNDKTKLKNAIEEAVNCMTRIAAENAAKKDIIDSIVEDFELPKKYVSKAIKTRFDMSFDQLKRETEDFETFYETIMGS